MKNSLVDFVESALRLPPGLGNLGRVQSLDSDTQKVSCDLEEQIYEGAIRFKPGDATLFAEGFPDVEGSGSVVWYLDPVDGTAYYARQRSDNPFDVSIVVAAATGPTYGDVIESAVGDFTSREIWATNSSRDGRTVVLPPKMGQLSWREVTAGGNTEHDPIFQTDAYFPENAAFRLMLSNPENSEWPRFEVLNMGSMVLQGVKVANGEADALFNLVGPKGYELTAMYAIARGAGATTLDARTGQELGSTEIGDPNARTPIIMAGTDALARRIYDHYDRNRDHVSTLVAQTADARRSF
jgi:fructose-1,6-bisphosphatase/inositol monophosphatase family enzyme